MYLTPETRSTNHKQTKKNFKIAPEILTVAKARLQSQVFRLSESERFSTKKKRGRRRGHVRSTFFEQVE